MELRRIKVGMSMNKVDHGFRGSRGGWVSADERRSSVVIALEDKLAQICGLLLVSAVRRYAFAVWRLNAWMTLLRSSAPPMRWCGYRGLRGCRGEFLCVGGSG